jgi:hypothetical protein
MDQKADSQALPTIGSQLAGGTYAGITTGKDGVPYALILLDDKPAERLTWRKAVNWAKKLDAELPTRPEGALLFANLKDSFEPAAHWTSERLDSSWAWFQYFTHGHQHDVILQDDELRARAVRRLPIQSLVI